ncbi:MurR/RpiR family transcriptional regulator [Pontivivens ytuae]|uniref:MurR/RpiR family transcriptional regulator n=1 Tax=Pontivivens ytuae TaxID=2789856 RepID=A0A7S9QD61_9RHOB|nr:MurR/RpiR family transcriptional regulator [Pontivivens ytuae]QPH54948.1 MurR/RpiR family transcriptional regulator [Pontivivens ytuae]
MLQPLRDLIADNADKLTGVDTRLLEVLSDDPVRAAMENGREVSARAGVHPASAVRLAKRLGFGGYPEFKAFLRDSLIRGGEDFADPSARMAARLTKSQGEGLLAAAIESEVNALRQLGETLSDDDIREVARVLRSARRIFVFARGHGAALAQLMTLRLTRSGYDAVDLADAGILLPERLAQMTQDDVLCLFSFRQPRRQTEDLMAEAAEMGARTIAITDLGGGRLTVKPDLHLSASRGGAGEVQSLTVPMTIVNAIILHLAAIDEGQSMRALQRYAAVKKRFGS